MRNKKLSLDMRPYGQRPNIEIDVTKGDDDPLKRKHSPKLEDVLCTKLNRLQKRLLIGLLTLFAGQGLILAAIVF